MLKIRHCVNHTKKIGVARNNTDKKKAHTKPNEKPNTKRNGTHKVMGFENKNKNVKKIRKNQKKKMC